MTSIFANNFLRDSTSFFSRVSSLHLWAWKQERNFSSSIIFQKKANPWNPLFHLRSNKKKSCSRHPMCFRLYLLTRASEKCPSIWYWFWIIKPRYGIIAHILNFTLIWFDLWVFCFVSFGREGKKWGREIEFFFCRLPKCVKSNLCHAIGEPCWRWKWKID